MPFVDSNIFDAHSTPSRVSQDFFESKSCPRIWKLLWNKSIRSFSLCIVFPSREQRQLYRVFSCFRFCPLQQRPALFRGWWEITVLSPQPLIPSPTCSLLLWRFVLFHFVWKSQRENGWDPSSSDFSKSKPSYKKSSGIEHSWSACFFAFVYCWYGWRCDSLFELKTWRLKVSGP